MAHPVVGVISHFVGHVSQWVLYLVIFGMKKQCNYSTDLVASNQL